MKNHKFNTRSKLNSGKNNSEDEDDDIKHKKNKKQKKNESGSEPSSPTIDPREIFNINDYNIQTLNDLIQLIHDLMNKMPPPKSERRKLPKKIYRLKNTLDDLIELNNMVGLTKLKQQIIDQLLYFIQDHHECVMLHTVIEGPPGTGKTTVARLMASIYSNVGIFKTSKFNIVKRDDLVGQYLGETTIKTMDTLERCKNGVMLIDEAYALGSIDNRDFFAKEAVDAINQYLTDNVDKIVCIIAGYKKELNDCFFSQNKGLRRRFPWTFTIDNFTQNELAQIFWNMIEWHEYYELDKDIDMNFIRNQIDIKYFIGNAGDLDNIFSRIRIINNRRNFGREDNFIIKKDVLEESFKSFYDLRKEYTSSIPSMMYT